MVQWQVRSLAHRRFLEAWSSPPSRGSRDRIRKWLASGELKATDGMIVMAHSDNGTCSACEREIEPAESATLGIDLRISEIADTPDWIVSAFLREWFSREPRRMKTLLSLIAVLAAVAGPIDAPAQEYVRIEGTVAWITGNSLRLYTDALSVPPAYVISGGYLVPVPQPRQTVEVDLRGLPQTEYSFMRPGERVAVIGVFDGDRRLVVATSLIRGPGLQAP